MAGRAPTPLAIRERAGVREPQALFFVFYTFTFKRGI